MQKEFELWYAAFAKSAYDQPDLGKRASGEYSDPNCQRYWDCWQASRALLEIQLPERLPRDYLNDYWGGAANGFNQCLDTCRIALKLSGVEPK